MNSKGIFIGLCGRDIVYYSKDNLPGENMKMRTNDFRAYIGGPAATAAITFSLLGGSATLVTNIGNSPEGILIKKELSVLGINLVDLANTEFEIPNTSAIHINTSNGNRTVLSGQNNLLARPSLSNINDLINECDFCLYDCNMNDQISPLLEIIAKHDVTLVLDCGAYKDGIEPFLEVANEIISSEHFKDKNNKNVLDMIGLKNSLQNAAITRGENSIIFSGKDGSGEIFPQVKTVIDTLGAGDVLHGAYCYYRFEKNNSFKDALRQACEVATHTISFKGSITGVKDFVYNQINQQNKNITNIINKE